MSLDLLFGLDALAIAVFLGSYYFGCYRQGFRIDIWHSQLFLACVLPNLIMLPFARSELNVVSVGRDIQSVIAAVPFVFLMTLVGYSSMLIGAALWRLQLGAGVRRLAVNLIDFVPRCSMMAMSSRLVLVAQTVLCLLLQAFILGLYFSRSGFGFDLRGFTFENPSLRPVALVISGYSIFIAAHCLARYVDTKEHILLSCTLVLTLGMVFFGARGNLVAIYLNVLLCYLVKQRDKISLLRIGVLLGFLLTFIFYLGNVRGGVYSLGDFFAAFAVLLFYGNNFSDLRDFAWVYSSWDHVYWGGKTYLAAVTSFVPRFASEFRDTWGMGVATARTVGFDPEVHPGLRPGEFGEAFFNYGVIGVIVVGLFLGIVFKRVDKEVKASVTGSSPSMMRAFSSTMMLGVAGTFAVSAGFSGLYVLGLAYLISWFGVLLTRAAGLA